MQVSRVEMSECLVVRRLVLCPVLAVVMALVLAGCDMFIPMDPDKTLARVQKDGVINVGVIHHPPFVNIVPKKQGGAKDRPASTAPEGREVELITGFADELGVTPKWQVVDIASGFKRLQERRIDVLIGGLTTETPFLRAGFTRPYDEQETDRATKGTGAPHVMAVPQGENRMLVTLDEYLRDVARPAPEAAE